MSVIVGYTLPSIGYMQVVGPDFVEALATLTFQHQTPPKVGLFLPEVTAYGAIDSQLPISEISETCTFYRAPSFLEDWYYRVHIWPWEINLGNLLSSQTRTLEVWNAHFEGITLLNISAVDLDDLVLTEPFPAPTVFIALEARTYAVNISVNGSPVIDGRYVFDFGTELPSVHLTGRRVTVWPFVPQTKIRESLEWQTDIVPSYNTEQRIALRQAPRQSFQYRFQFTPVQYSKAKAISTQWAHRVYGMPVWSEALFIGPLAAGTTMLTFDTTNADFRADDIILVWESDVKNEAVETLTMTSTTMALKIGLTQSYAMAYVMPIRYARTLAGTEFGRSANSISTGRMTFLVTNNVDYGASINLPSYRGLEVMTDRSAVVGTLQEKILKPVDVFDNGSGVLDVDQTQSFMIRSETLILDALDRASAWRMRKWLHYRRGKQKSFWLPSWNADLLIVQDLSTSSTALTVSPINYPLFYSVTDIMILLKSGVKYYRRILSGVTQTDGTEALSMDSAMGITLNVADIDMVCFMKHVRLDTDRLDLIHDYAGRVTASMLVTETPEGD